MALYTDRLMQYRDWTDILSTTTQSASEPPAETGPHCPLPDLFRGTTRSKNPHDNP